MSHAFVLATSQWQQVSSCLLWDELIHLDSYHIVLVCHTSMPQLMPYRMSLATQKTPYLSFSRLKMVFNYPVTSDFFFKITLKPKQIKSWLFWHFPFCSLPILLPMNCPKRPLLTNLKNWWKNGNREQSQSFCIFRLFLVFLVKC